MCDYACGCMFMCDYACVTTHVCLSCVTIHSAVFFLDFGVCSFGLLKLNNLFLSPIIEVILEGLDPEAEDDDAGAAGRARTRG